MKIHSIEFNNFRCFLTGKLEFPINGKVNMTLLVGPNGGGKSETLYAFWWAFYGFDYTRLPEKKETPYALNSKLYRELEKSSPNTEMSCSCTVVFEDKGTVYNIKKTAIYKKTEKQIRCEEYQEFSKYKGNGELTLPIRDKDRIARELNRIIPKKILYGIIFDGERMKELSRHDENSVNAIEGVITDITNQELIETCMEYFNSIQRNINKEIKKHSTSSNDLSLNEIVSELEKKENEYSSLQSQTEQYEDELLEVDNRLSEISKLLEENKEVQEIEQERKIDRKNLDQKTKELDEHYKNFSQSLKDGYLLAADNLFDSVDKIIKKYDVPQDLTVPAVKNIIVRPRCICGRVMDDEAKKTLNSLITSLPPDNINSTLAEILRQLQMHVTDTKRLEKDQYDVILDNEKDIKNLKLQIASLSARITKIDDDGEMAREAKELEDESKGKLLRKGFLETEIPRCKDAIKQLESKITKLQRDRDNYASNNDSLAKLNQKITFIEKSKKALLEIKNINKKTALESINVLLGDAFYQLSEDAKRGRKIKIIINSKARYQIVVYMENDYNDLKQEYIKKGRLDNLKNSGLNDNEIDDILIQECADSNSTGQAKMNTFAFVKAILDYSNMDKDKSDIGIKKNYPLLIDAPFGDIAELNLKQSTHELHNFSEQVILMIDKDKYETLHDAFDAYTAKRYYFKKEIGENHSTIEEWRL